MSNQSTPAQQRQFQAETASAVARICMLPDPRPFYQRPWLGLTRHDTEACAERQMEVKARYNRVQAPARDSADFQRIMERARALADAGVRQCMVRDFEYPGTNGRYYGYRGADGQCHTTHNQQEAQNARSRYPQQAPRR